MAEFLLCFKDLDPSLTSTQTVDATGLDDAVQQTTVALREIIADHIRHGKVLTMTSAEILGEDQVVLATLAVQDILWEIMVGARPFLKDPSSDQTTTVSPR